MKIITAIKENKKYIFLGLICGLINGLCGSGGGIIFVVGSTLLFQANQKEAQASAIPAMLAFSIISAIVYLLKKTPLQTEILIPVVIGSAAGGIIGALVLNKLSNKILRYVFAVMIIFSGVRMLCS